MSTPHPDMQERRREDDPDKIETDWLKGLLALVCSLIAPSKHRRWYCVVVAASVCGAIALTTSLWHVSYAFVAVAVAVMIAIIACAIALSWCERARELAKGPMVIPVISLGDSQRPMPGPKYRDSTIQVFLPDWTDLTESPFYQDGRDQFKGFEQATRDVGAPPNLLPVEYKGMKADWTGERLINEMQKLYKDRNATYFIMTMSAKVWAVHKLFAQWHDQCRKDGVRLPVLVATVASAPNLANAERGVVRWYVRSEEESVLLAMYLAWACKVSHAGVFFVEHTPGRQDSAYGNRGRDEFSKRFKSLGGKVQCYPAVGADAKNRVHDWVADCALSKASGETLGAFVVGYGDMILATLSALIENNFSGPIACTSTLTGKTWQPHDRKLDANIVTVMPRLKNEKDSIEGDNRNVVFFFAREALRRVLEMTADDPNPLLFLDRWRKGERAAREDRDDEMEQEHLANGDIIVHVDIADYTKWRG